MSNTILGLPSSDKFRDEGLTRESFRRQSLFRIPRGNVPLTAIFSMLKSEPINAITHTWYEKEYVPASMQFRGTNPITSTAPADGDADGGTNMSTGAKTTTTDHFIKVDTTERLAVNDLIRLTTNGVTFQITAITRGLADPKLNGYITCRPIRDYTAAASDDDSTGGNQIDVVGTAHAEASASANPSGVRVPYNLTNQTYIAKEAATFSLSQVQQTMEFDKNGEYKDRMRDVMLDHFVKLENQTIFGQRATRPDPANPEKEIRTMSGIIEYLQLWDAGSTGLQIDGSPYAPYSMYSAATNDDDPRKRIIENASGTINKAKMNVWFERISTYCTNKSNDKMILCGNGVLNAIDQLIDRETSYQLEDSDNEYGFRIKKLKTLYGDFYLTTHPLFNVHPIYTNWMLIIDIHSMCYRPLRNRDTELQKDITHGNGFDERKDQFLTEGLLEFHHARNNMLIKNVVNYSVT